MYSQTLKMVNFYRIPDTIEKDIAQAKHNHYHKWKHPHKTLVGITNKLIIAHIL